jgi:hypothetical protein
MEIEALKGPDGFEWPAVTKSGGDRILDVAVRRSDTPARLASSQPRTS